MCGKEERTRQYRRDSGESNKVNGSTWPVGDREQAEEQAKVVARDEEGGKRRGTSGCGERVRG